MANTDSVRTQILKSALILFQRRGYEGTSMKRIADTQNISPQALYWYFDSKAEVFYEAMSLLFREFQAYVAIQLKSDDPTIRLQQLVRAHVEWQLAEQELAGAFSRNIETAAELTTELENKKRAFIDAQREYVEEVRTILAKGKQNGRFFYYDERVTAMAIISLCEGVATWYNPDHELSPETIADHYVQMVTSMVATPVRL